MKTYSKILLALVATLAVACNKSSGDAGTDASGNCTQETIDAYNDVNHKAQMFDISQDVGYATGVQNACTKLQGLIGGRSCNATDLKTGSSTNASYANVQSTCDKAKTIVTGEMSSSPSSTSTSASDSYGYCTQTAISAYNDVLNKARAFDSARTVSSAKEIQTSCARFKSVMGSKSCLAQEAASYSTQSLSYSKVDTMCVKADDIVNTPVSNEPAIGSELTVSIIDATTFNKLASSGGKTFLQQGKVVAAATGSSSGKAICTYIGEQVKANTVLKLKKSEFQTQDKDRQITFANDDLSAVIICAKSVGSNWTQSDIASAFGVTAVVSDRKR